MLSTRPYSTQAVLKFYYQQGLMGHQAIMGYSGLRQALPTTKFVNDAKHLALQPVKGTGELASNS